MTDDGIELKRPLLGNIPLQNLREEFSLYLETLSKPGFEVELRHAMRRPVRTPLFDWHGAANDLLTLVVQRAVQGLEAYVGGAAWVELISTKRMTPEVLKLVRNPFEIQKRSGTASAYYHELPGLVSPMLSLKILHPKLWPSVTFFYKEVRNPLFHGMQLQRTDAAEVLEYLRLIEKVYGWVDYWHKPTPPMPFPFVIRVRRDTKYP